MKSSGSDRKISSCCICSSQKADTVLQFHRSMTSDARIVSMPLEKVACRRCGTVRSAENFDVLAYYQDDYNLTRAVQDPLFVFKDERKPRSQMIYEWMVELAGDLLKAETSLLEIGCGNGSLLRRFPQRKKQGIEPAGQSFTGMKLPFPIRLIGYDQLGRDERYECIIAFGVLEHIPDPANFIKVVSRHLTPEGFALIGLPIQEKPSYDVFFSDHFYHFNHGPLVYLFNSCGFSVKNYQIGYKCMTNFALYLISGGDARLSLPPLTKTQNPNIDVAKQWLSALDSFLLENREQRIVAFGNGEAARFFQTYSMEIDNVSLFIDDMTPGKNVVTIDEAIRERDLRNSSMAMLINPEYISFIKSKFCDIEGMSFYSPFLDAYV